jgi:hypothetical protein
MEIAVLNSSLEPFLTIKAAELVSSTDSRADSAASRLWRRTIDYSATAHQGSSGSRLFWGPYIELQAGVYLFQFEGRVEGMLMVDFVCQRGTRQLKAARLTDFSNPVCLVLTRQVEDFEVRGATTKTLRSLTLKLIEVHRAFVDRSAMR